MAIGRMISYLHTLISCFQIITATDTKCWELIGWQGLLALDLASLKLSQSLEPCSFQDPPQLLPFAAFQLLQAFRGSQLSIFKVRSGWQLHPAPKEGVVIFQ